MTDRPDPALTASEFVGQLMSLGGPGSPSRAETASPGNDRPVTVRMGDVFALAKRFIDLEPDQIEELLESSVHEVRVGAVSIMDFQARRRGTPTRRREALYQLYLRRHDRIDDWDLVDRAAPSVVGQYLDDKPRDPLYRLARSENVWERRTAIVATWHFIRHGQLDDTFAIAELSSMTASTSSRLPLAAGCGRPASATPPDYAPSSTPTPPPCRAPPCASPSSTSTATNDATTATSKPPLLTSRHGTTRRSEPWR